MTISYIACSLSSPSIQARKLVLDMLTFLCYYSDALALPLVLSALDSLSQANNESGRFDYWFKSLDFTLSGRGKMGSLVGASDEIRKNQGVDSSLNDYAVGDQSNPECIRLIFIAFLAKQHHPCSGDTEANGRL
jgi:cytokinesis protein